MGRGGMAILFLPENELKPFFLKNKIIFPLFLQQEIVPLAFSL